MKNQVKKLVVFLSAVVVLTGMMCFGVSALEPTGQCGDNVYWNYNEVTGELVISGEGDMENFGYLAANPFYSSGSVIRSVIIEEGITSIGSVTFYGQEVEKVVLPKSLKQLGVYSFYGCDNLTEIVLPDGLEIIGSYAFEECDNLETVIIPDSIIEIGVKAFYGTPCYEFGKRENGVLYIGNHLIDIDSSFYESEYKVKDHVVSIAAKAFYDNNVLETIIFPKSLKGIGEYAFACCKKLENFIFYDGLKMIGSSAFSECCSITEVIIPDSVQLIESYAFEYCDKLANITLSEFVIIEDGVFSGTAYCNKKSNWENNLLYLNKHLIDAEYGFNEYTIKDGTLFVGDAVFYENFDIETIKIPNSVIYIGVEGFYGCKNLKDVYFSGSEEEWNEIIIRGANNDLLDATIHFENTDIVNPDEPSAGPEQPEDPSDTTADCSCNCHKSGFMSLIYKILRFFWKLFKINPVCACGATHY